MRNALKEAGEYTAQGHHQFTAVPPPNIRRRVEPLMFSLPSCLPDHSTAGVILRHWQSHTATSFCCYRHQKSSSVLHSEPLIFLSMLWPLLIHLIITCSIFDLIISWSNCPLSELCPNPLFPLFPHPTFLYTREGEKAWSRHAPTISSLMCAIHFLEQCLPAQGHLGKHFFSSSLLCSVEFMWMIQRQK